VTSTKTLSTRVKKRIAVVGASGAIGRELVAQFDAAQCEVIALSRTPTRIGNSQWLPLDLTDEGSIAVAAAKLQQGPALDAFWVATGVLHDGNLQPEKSLAQIDGQAFLKSLQINSVGPALVAKHFLPLLDKHTPSRAAFLSARVGSIADNYLGGWYSYRCAKAALNMFIRTAAIELARSHKQSLIVGLHPGTVDSNLSKPFQRNVPAGKLFTPEYSAERLIAVLAELNQGDSGKVFAWDGQPIAY